MGCVRGIREPGRYEKEGAMKMLAGLVLGTTLMVVAMGCVEGPAGPQGPAGPPGPAGVAGVAGQASEPIVVTSSGVAPKYSPEMYDDCRDAFGGISAAGWRQLMDDEDLARLTDDDVRALFRVMCLMMAASDVDLFQEFFDDALPLSSQ